MALFGRSRTPVTYRSRSTGRIVNFQVEGLRELKAQIARIEKFPKKNLTKAAKLGMAGPLKDAKQAAPKGETGLLKKGLKRQLEKANRRKKSVYRLVWDKRFTENYLKPTTGVYGGKTPVAYYPHSQEYGFKTAKGRTKGKYFARDAIEKNEKASLQKIIDSLWDDVQRMT